MRKDKDRWYNRKTITPFTSLDTKSRPESSERGISMLFELRIACECHFGTGHLTQITQLPPWSSFSPDLSRTLWNHWQCQRATEGEFTNPVMVNNYGDDKYLLIAALIRSFLPNNEEWMARILWTFQTLNLLAAISNDINEGWDYLLIFLLFRHRKHSRGILWSIYNFVFDSVFSNRALTLCLSSINDKYTW